MFLCIKILIIFFLDDLPRIESTRRRFRHRLHHAHDHHERDDDDNDTDIPIKERCEALATAITKMDGATLRKLMDKHVHLSYANFELPTGGHWVGDRGLKAYAERYRNTVKDVTNKIRVVTADAGFQRCVLKYNVTGTFIRSGSKFRDVTLYNTVDWSLGRVTRMRLIDGGNYDAMMQAYRTRSEANTVKLFRAVYTHGPGAKLDELVSDKALVLLGRRGYTFNGTTAVSKALTAIKKFAGEFGLSRESLLLPLNARKSKQCEFMFADEHNHGGECRVYNLKSRTTSFKHVDFVYRIRFDDNGKLDRLFIVESRAFLPGELVREIKTSAGDHTHISAGDYTDLSAPSGAGGRASGGGAAITATMTGVTGTTSANAAAAPTDTNIHTAPSRSRINEDDNDIADLIDLDDDDDDDGEDRIDRESDSAHDD